MEGTYFEPFLGGGAVFFCLRPPRAILSDVNQELVQCMRSVRDEVEKVASIIPRWANRENCYYRVRRMTPLSRPTVAARLIYLSHTSWGGLYRVNRKGCFNVPYGRNGRAVCDLYALRSCAHLLRRADILCADFEPVINRATARDTIYADPPYTTRGQNNGFVRYNEDLFAWRDQERLAFACHRARRRGALVAVSGLHHPSVIALYKGWWAIRVIRFSSVSMQPAARHSVAEVVLFSHKPRFVCGTHSLQTMQICCRRI